MLIILLLVLLISDNLLAETFEIGSGKLYKKPSQVSKLVKDGDTVLIDSGIYSADVCVWQANNLVIIGTGNGYAHLQANGAFVEGKGIWVIKGNNTSVENIEFSGAVVPDNNGAGIRQEGENLIIRNCYFHHNQDGILAGDNTNSEIYIERSEFAYNGFGDGYTHNIYINHIKKFTLKFCYTHHCNVGHCIKSRAYENHIEYNRIMDEWDGNSSRLTDLPNGGLSYIIGNVLMQGVKTNNSTLIGYGKEKNLNPERKLFIINNTMVNYRHNGIFIDIEPGTELVFMRNNLFAGAGTVISTNIIDSSNCIHFNKIEDAHFIQPDILNYGLTEKSHAINNGIVPGNYDDYDLNPVMEYVHPIDYKVRDWENEIDIGAFEYHSNNNVEGYNDVSKLNIYPNPAQNNLNLYYLNLGNSINLNLFDISGKKIKNFYGVIAKEKSTETIDISDCQEGIYFLQIYNNELNYIKKFIIKR